MGWLHELGYGDPDRSSGGFWGNQNKLGMKRTPIEEAMRSYARVARLLLVPRIWHPHRPWFEAGIREVASLFKRAKKQVVRFRYTDENYPRVAELYKVGQLVYDPIGDLFEYQVIGVLHESIPFSTRDDLLVLYKILRNEIEEKIDEFISRHGNTEFSTEMFKRKMQDKSIALSVSGWDAPTTPESRLISADRWNDKKIASILAAMPDAPTIMNVSWICKDIMKAIPLVCLIENEVMPALEEWVEINDLESQYIPHRWSSMRWQCAVDLADWISIMMYLYAKRILSIKYYPGYEEALQQEFNVYDFIQIAQFLCETIIEQAETIEPGSGEMWSRYGQILTITPARNPRWWVSRGFRLQRWLRDSPARRFFKTVEKYPELPSKLPPLRSIHCAR